MDCQDARLLLPLMTPTDESAAEWRAVREHLSVCAACRSARAIELRRDLELADRMQSVPVPIALSSQLMKAVSGTPVVAAPGRPSGINRRRWGLAATASVPVLVLCGWLVLCWFTPSRVAWQELRGTLASLEYSADWPLAPQAASPGGWPQIDGLRVAPAQQVPGTPAPVQVVAFIFQRSRSLPSVAGQLWMVEARRIREASAIPSLELAEVRYQPGSPHLVWRERGMIYVLEASGDVFVLEKLQRALRRTLA